MTSNNREAAIKETLKWEGGYSNNPSDPGGPTNWGITLADARKYWKKNATANDIKIMPKSIAIDIYRSKYWKTPYYDCDKLEAGVDLSVFDYGVNSGPARAKKALDESVGGPATETVIKINNQRMAFLRGLNTFPTFGVGWTRRVNGIRLKSLSMAKEPVQTPVATGTGLAAWFMTSYIAVTHYIHEHPYYTVGGLVLSAVAIGGIIKLIKRWKRIYNAQKSI